MLIEPMESVVHYRHSWEEVVELSNAIIPLAQAIKAVGTPTDRAKMRAILNCEFFRQRDALRMRNMLVRATKYTRAHLSDCLEFIRHTELAAAERLEEAVQAYWRAFLKAEAESIPVN
jgi:hypothetical protein